MVKKALLIISFFVVVTGAFAQQKYGHINSQEILVSMPEYKQMMATLERKHKEQQNKLAAMYKDYEKRQSELNEYGFGLMEAIREEKMIELDSLAKAIAAYEESVDGNLQELQVKLLKPLNDKYLKVVNAVSKENGYSYIFDLATGSVVYYPPNSGDITGLVKKKMGIND